jgi:hypothetical protein
VRYERTRNMSSTQHRVNGARRGYNPPYNAIIACGEFTTHNKSFSGDRKRERVGEALLRKYTLISFKPFSSAVAAEFIFSLQIEATVLDLRFSV